MRSASVRELLDGRLPRSDDGGLDAPVLRCQGPFTVVAFAPGEPGPWRGDPARLLSILSLYAESVDAEAMCTILGERLWALVQTPAAQPREGAVARLAENEPEALRTLRAFLDAHGDVKAAGEAAGVHPNTMRYRIRRLQQLYGLDLSDPNARMLAFLETRGLDRADSE